MLRVFEFGISEKRKEDNGEKNWKITLTSLATEPPSFQNIKRLTILHGMISRAPFYRKNIPRTASLFSFFFSWGVLSASSNSAVELTGKQ